MTSDRQNSVTAFGNIDFIIRSKLYRPPISRDHVHRSALLDRLDTHQQQPLTLVSAPAGYGKSTLVSCWLGGCNTASAWISLDGNDSQMRLFLSYVITAIRDIFPAACRQTMAMLESPHLPPVTVLTGNLLNELAMLDRPFILVLDDYHFLREQAIHQLLTRILEHPPRCMHLVIISRHDPPLPLTSLRAKGKLLEIRSQDLRFSRTETKLFLEYISGKDVDTSLAIRLEKKTEGWVTGLRLAALATTQRQAGAGAETGPLDDNRDVLDYTTEIILQQPMIVQEYLLKTAILERFCAPLCEAVCLWDKGPGQAGMNGEHFLDLLERTNLFVISLDEAGQWLRYHHLFQAALKRLLTKRFDAEAIDKLHLLASHWLAKNGYIEEALTHAFEGKEPETAAMLCGQHRHRMMNRGQWHHLGRWLDWFSTDFINTHPDLLLAKAWRYQRQADFARLFAILEQLENRVAAGDKEYTVGSIFWGELQTLRSFQHLIAVHLEQAENAAREALNLVPTEYHSVYGFATIVLATSLQMRGNPEQARAVIYAALQMEECVNPGLRIMLQAAHCLLYWLTADLTNLEKAANQLLDLGQKHGQPESVANGSFFLGALCYLRNDLTQAENILTQVAGEYAISSIANYCESVFLLSMTLQATGRQQEARAVITKATDFLLEIGNTDLHALCEVFQAELALRQGCVSEAYDRLGHLPPLPSTPVLRYYVPQLTLPRILVKMGSPASLLRAATILGDLYAFFLSIHATRTLTDILILQALLHAAGEQEANALKKLTEALALAEPGRCLRPFLDAGPEVAGLLSRLLQQQPVDNFAQQVYAVFEKESSYILLPHTTGKRVHSPMEIEEFSIPLSSREIEVLKLLHRGASNHEIAETLYISPETVKRHLSTIYRKLRVKNRQLAVIRGKSLGVL